MSTILYRGGATVGMASASWPFATLQVTDDLLELTVSMIGKFVFRPEDIVSLDPYDSFLRKGIQIRHRIGNYKSDIIFRTFDDPALIIAQIKQSGFFNAQRQRNAQHGQYALDMQISGANPLKKASIIAFIVLWNLLLLSDYLNFFGPKNKTGFPIGGTLTALGLLILSSVLLLTSERFRRLLLKKGRTLNDIKTFLYFIIPLAAFLFLICLIVTINTK